MSDKHRSGSSASANWRLDSLWRPLSQHSHARSSNISVRDGFAPHWSRIVPSILSGRPSAPPSEGDAERGTEALLSGSEDIYSPVRNRSNTFGTDESTLGTLAAVSRPQTRDAPSATRSLQADAFDRLVRLKTVSSRHSRKYPYRIPSVPSLAEDGIDSGPWSGHYSSNTGRSRQSKRPSIRESTLPIAELPALPTSPREKKLPRRPIDMHRTAIPTIEHQGLLPPPVPPKPTHESLQSNSDRHLVLFGPADRGNAANWPHGKKWLSTIVLSLMAFCVALASTITSPAAQKIASHFRISKDVVVLDTALFMLGIALGTIVWSPLSDQHGRRLPMYVGFGSFLIFQIPVAVAENLTTICICRLCAGLFGSSALTTTTAAISDLWVSAERGVAISLLAAAIIAGPAVGTLAGGFIVESAALGWRWCSWIVLVIGVFIGPCCVIFYTETSPNILLQERAKKLRRSTRDWALHAPVDELDFNSKVFVEVYIWRPLVFLFTEPILFFTTLYTSFVYGLLYLFVEATKTSYVDERHWDLGTAGLPFLAVIFGVLIGCVVNLLFVTFRQRPRMKKYGRCSPEEPLLPFLVGCVALTMGLFLFGWTARVVSPVAEIAAGVFLGVGFLLVHLQGTSYLLDVYSTYSSAALAVNVAVRSLFATSFCVFARYMFVGMGLQWASTLLGLISIALMPIPIVFYRLGVKIRAMSSFTAKLPGSSHSEGGKYDR